MLSDIIVYMHTLVSCRHYFDQNKVFDVEQATDRF